MCLVNAQTHLVRICKQTRFKKCFVAGIEVGAQLFFLFFVGRTISRVLELALKDVCRPHCGTPPVERTPPGKSEPGLVPEEDQVGLDRQALFHDRSEERRVGKECRYRWPPEHRKKRTEIAYTSHA